MSSTHTLNITDLDWFSSRSVVASSTEGIGKRLVVLTECGLDGNLTVSMIVEDNREQVHYRGHNLLTAIEAYNTLNTDPKTLRKVELV